MSMKKIQVISIFLMIIGCLFIFQNEVEAEVVTYQGTSSVKISDDPEEYRIMDITITMDSNNDNKGTIEYNVRGLDDPHQYTINNINIRKENGKITEITGIFKTSFR